MSLGHYVVRTFQKSSGCVIEVLSRVINVWKLDPNQLLVSQGLRIMNSNNKFIKALIDRAIKNRVILSTNASL